ncbi:hypothetical protein PIB30_089978, partial [Stylosanthes scabra]|nr:hypothetical protein [Stylosanthes scabra]
RESAPDRNRGSRRLATQLRHLRICFFVAVREGCGRVIEDRSVGSEHPDGAIPTTVSATKVFRHSARLPPPTTNLVFASPPNCATFESDSSWPCGMVTEERSVGSELPQGATPTTVSATKVFHHLLNFFPRI